MPGIEPWMIECRDQRIKELEGLLKETQKEQDQIGHALGICYCADDRCHGAGPIEAMLEEIHELQRIRNAHR